MVDTASAALPSATQDTCFHCPVQALPWAGGSDRVAVDLVAVGWWL